MAGSNVVNLFNTGKSALFANKAALATTGHNIANVNTEGYSRQRVDMSASTPIKLGNVIYGTGTRVEQIERIADKYLVKQINQEEKLKGYAEESDIQLSHLEQIFNEISGGGMNTMLTTFFNEFRKLANDPDEEALRTSVREATKHVANDFRRINGSLEGIRNNVDTRIDAYVRDVNGYLDQIADLNEQIRRLEVSGGQAGDLHDKRDLLTKKLSSMLDVNIGDGDKGQMQIMLVGVGTLVSGTKVNHLGVEKTPEDLSRNKAAGSYDIVLDGATYPNITNRLNNSKLGALVKIRDEVVGGIKNRLDEMAYAVSKHVNTIHSVGYGKDGVSGRNLFKDIKEVHRASEVIDLDDSIKHSVNAIAASLDANAPADNRVAIAISKIGDVRMLNEGKATLDEYYNGMIADLAVIGNRNKNMLSHQKDIVNQLDKFRDSISGVSLDEETTKLIEYQHAMNASSKALQVADEVLQTVLNIRR